MLSLATLSLLVLLPWQHHQSRYLLRFAFLCVVRLEVERLLYWVCERLARLCNATAHTLGWHVEMAVKLSKGISDSKEGDGA